MTEEELRDIESRWNDKDGTSDWYGDIPALIAEVRRLQATVRPIEDAAKTYRITWSN